MNESILALVARVIGWFEPPQAGGPGHPPAKTVRVLATLRRFLREGTPWRGLRATDSMASGSTLRRRLGDWAGAGVLSRVHSMLVGMLRGQPDLARDLIVDSCSVRAKRGGDGSIKNLGRYAASWIACWPKRPSSTAALT